MNTNREKWIDEVMSSLRQIHPAEGNPHLHTRVMAKLNEPITRRPMQAKWVYVFSAVFTLMLLLNVLGWNSSSNSNDSISTQPVDIETVITEYSLENNYTSLP